MASGFNSARSQHKNLKPVRLPSATEIIEQMYSLVSEIEDPRSQRTRAHLLTDILIIGILSVITGGKGWEDMETYGFSKSNWLEQFLALPNGIPCPDTFRRVFERINPKVFERCFHR
ncbi:transposase family protein [Nostoc sp.]|uniref:transposase family protein n=1 Tax=Nostoc sp. TaxID=1180 RepID=UPI003FA54B47